MTAYYNEIDPYAAQWLRNLISKNLIAPGDVDERSIVDVQPDDLKSYTQCHFFAGIGGWSLAARLAGWPDHRPLWTGSCPCQPFSVAGKGEGKQDERHLWPTFFNLIRSRRPSVVMGEQVAAAVGKDWLDGVHSDLEGINYACGATVVPACAVDAPHRRDRLWFVAHSDASERREIDSLRGRMAGEHALPQGQETPGGFVADGESGAEDGALADPNSNNRFWWSGPLQVGWNSIAGQVAPGGNATRTQWRIKPGLSLLAHGVPARVGRLRAYGNAIVPQVAAEIMSAYVDAYGLPQS